jgi:hypothetical protein
MRRLLRPVVDYAVDSARALADEWNAFWYTPADPTLLGLLRVLTGLMLVYTHAVWGLALGAFYGPSSWLSKELVRTMQEGQYTYSFWWVVPDGGIWTAYGLSMAVLVLFTLGLWTRVTSVLSLIVAISFAQRAPAATFGLDQINTMLTLYLAIGPSGQALSLDRWRAGARRGEGPAPSARANLAQRLIQVHMCVIYAFAGFTKLQGEAWWTGEAMWMAFSNLEYQSVDMTWLAWYPRLMNAITHVSILWECSFCVLIWKPRLRPLMLAGAVALHVGIGACLGMWTFGLIMLVGCASFLPNERVREFVAALSAGRITAEFAMSPSHALPRGSVQRTPREEAMEPAVAADEGPSWT